MAACILFRDWTDAAPADSRITVIPAVEPYVPGEFFRRVDEMCRAHVVG